MSRGDECLSGTSAQMLPLYMLASKRSTNDLLTQSLIWMCSCLVGKLRGNEGTTNKSYNSVPVFISSEHLCHKRSEISTKTSRTVSESAHRWGDGSLMEEGAEGGGKRRGLALTSLSPSLIQFGPSKCWEAVMPGALIFFDRYLWQQLQVPLQACLCFGDRLDCLARTRLPQCCATGA